jgi:hypothetical protein
MESKSFFSIEYIQSNFVELDDCELNNWDIEQTTSVHIRILCFFLLFLVVSFEALNINRSDSHESQ